jgi:hypothetical protein
MEEGEKIKKVNKQLRIKKMKRIKDFHLIFASMLVFSLLFTSCQKEADLFNEDFTGAELKKVTITGSDATSVVLIAGQNIPVGNVSFADVDTNNDGIKDALEVTYMVESATLTDISFWIGSSEAGLPVNKAGNPVVGQFPYKFIVAGKTSYSFLVPFSAIGYSGNDEKIFKVASHASVTVNGKAEGAWGNGERIIQRGNWAMWFNITLSKDPLDIPVEKESFKTFAYNSATSLPFSDYGFNEAGQWGWTNKISTGTTTFELLNKKLEYIGSVEVTYNGSNATVSYSLSGAYSFDEVYYYVGSDVLPVKKNEGYTVATGQFPVLEQAVGKTYTKTISGLSGDIIYFAGGASIFD